MEYISPEEFTTDVKTTCCFTGHRRRDLPEDNSSMRRLTSVLDHLCHDAYNSGYRTFITGMAEGVDLICADLIYKMKRFENKSDANIICALPYPEHKRELKQPMDRYMYDIILRVSSAVVVCSFAGNRERYKLRNTFMVSNSSKVIGVYKRKDKGSGTLQTLNLAKKFNIDTDVISLDDKRLFQTPAIPVSMIDRVNYNDI